MANDAYTPTAAGEFDCSPTFSVVMLHLLRDEDTINMCVDKLTTQEVSAKGGATCGYLWYVSEEYYKENAKVMPWHLIEMKLVDRVTALGKAGTSDQDLANIEAFMEWAKEVEEGDIITSDVTKDLQDLQDEMKVTRPLQHALDNNATAEEIQQLVEEGTRNAAIVSERPTNPMDFLETVMEDSAPTPVGAGEVMYFNQLWQGGPMGGEFGLLVGPTGGYKTTMCIDIASAMAHAHEYCMYLTYEQAFDGKTILNKRMISGMTRLSPDCFVKGYQRSAEEQAKVEQAQKVNKYLVVHDRAGKPDTVANIAKMVDTEIRAGRTPKLVIVDQLQTWLLHLGVDEDKLRHKLRDVCLQLKAQVCERYNVPVLALHQLQAALNSASPARVPTITDAAECRGMPQWCDFMFLLGNEDKETNILWTVAAKTRRGVYTKLLVHADGATCHLRTTADYESVDGAIVKKGQGNVIPKDKPKMQGGGW